MSSSLNTLRGAASRSRYLLPALMLVAGLCAVVSAQQQAPFRSGASTVAVYTTVTDSSGRLVPNLTQEDFEKAYYVRDRYRPTCMRVEGEGEELSKMVCRRPEE